MFKYLVFFPLINFFISWPIGKIFGKRYSIFFSIFLLSASCFLSFLGFHCLALHNVTKNYSFGIWFTSGDLFVTWNVLFDSLSMTMYVVVTTISLLVHIYSCSYMDNDPGLPKFLSFLSLFTFFMLVLVSSTNFLQMFIGWEGVGICSYLLINYWYTRIQANKSAIKALLVNRVGDAGVILGILVLFFNTGSVDFSTIFSTTFLNNLSSLNETFFGINFNFIEITCLLLFLGTVGKSAQIGLHTWLPDAMEGPTPVSALLHAATMVTAGVFLLIRCSPLLQQSIFFSNVILIVGSLTAFFAATTAFFQNDIKKIIAYSTCSQLGYMVAACGVFNFSAALFHLFTHAFFKALLFLSAGVIIHGLSNEQDIRKMGGVAKIFPFTYTVFIIGSLALTGFPFLSGFFSKEIIIESVFLTNSTYGYFSYFLLVISSMFTTLYSVRLLYWTFLSKPNTTKLSIENQSEGTSFMVFSLFILCIGSIFAGFVFKDCFIGPGSLFHTFDTYSITPNIFLNNIYAEFINPVYKNFPVILNMSVLLLSFLSFFFFKNKLLNIKLSDKFILIYNFFNRKWFFDYIYNFYICFKIAYFSHMGIYINTDKGFLEKIGPDGSKNLIYFLSFFQSKLNTGFVYHYLLWIFLAVFYFILMIEILYYAAI